MVKSGEKLSFTEHLEELRRRLIVCVIVFITASATSYSLIDKILPFLIKPVGKLVFIAPTESFLAYIQIALFLGFFISLPVILFQIWQFISSALKPNEKKYILFFGPLSLVFFFCGAVFSYTVVIPIGLKFLLGFSSGDIEPMISVRHYISFVFTMIISFGILFEMPVAAIFLTRLKVITPSFLISKWRHAIVAVFILAAILTPPDAVTQILLAVPLIALYFIGILFSRIVYR